MINMYEILKNLVLMKTTPRSELEKKIWTSWAAGNLTDAEKDELLQLSFENLSPEAEAPEVAELYKRILSELESVKNEITAIKADIEVIKTGEPAEPDPGETTTTVQEWKPYDAIVNTGYDYGAVVTHNGKYYIDSLAVVKNVWEPGSSGIDERYWMEITKEDAEAVTAGTKTPDAVMGKE